MKAVIMAGGMGTRIASVRSDVPKPMIELCGKPVLQYQVENLRASGLTDITIVTGHLGDVIRSYFGDGSRFGVHITYFTEDHPLGTAGALFKMPELTEDFLLLCGDVLFSIDFRRFIAFHREHHALATLMAHPNAHPYDSSLLVTELLPPEPGKMPQDSHRVIRWMNKEDERLWYKNRVNAGIEIISPQLLQETRKHFVPRHPETPDKIDLDRDVLKPAVAGGGIYAYDTSEYIKDMGTPDRYRAAEEDIRSGIVAAKNLSCRQRAVFLDRDGTLNRDAGFISDCTQLELLPGTAAAVRRLNEAGILAIVVTNQPVIARGEASFEQLQEIHNKLETLLGREGAYLDAVYCCPHHPDKGFAGERPDYKIPCSCRKPQPGMLLQAAADFNIDLAASCMAGDTERDVQAGKNAGCGRNVLVSKDYTLADFVNDYLAREEGR
ncbi:MAG: HAD-IIIA family hydrolase [Treponema sp.]|nr:HAD-IIIA family hydrolase [Treponema sp.]